MVFNLSETNSGGGGGEWMDISDAFTITQYSEEQQMPGFGETAFVTNGSLVGIYIEITEPSDDFIVITPINSAYAPRNTDQCLANYDTDGYVIDIPTFLPDDGYWESRADIVGAISMMYPI